MDQRTIHRGCNWGQAGFEYANLSSIDFVKIVDHEMSPLKRSARSQSEDPAPAKVQYVRNNRGLPKNQSLTNKILTKKGTHKSQTTLLGLQAFVKIP